MNKPKHSLHDHIGYWLNKFAQEVRFSFEAKLEREEITVPQWCILISLYNEDAKNIIGLTNFIGIDKGAISRVVSQLEAMQLVFRKPGHNRRTGVVCLSKKGQQLTRKLADYADLNDQKFFAVLSPSEQHQLKLILKKLLDHTGIVASGGWLNN